MTREELAVYDGKDGRRAYVAVSGKVYDFTGSGLWPQGLHVKQHQAGTDLTEDLLKAPHVRALVERYPVVAQLEEVPVQTRRLPLVWIIAAVLAVALSMIFLLSR
jgi:predicted heme/steroid binding protein